MKWVKTSSFPHPILRRTIIVCLAAILLTWGLFYWRIHAYDSAIAEASRLYGVDARLIRAVIWKESRFSSKRVGKIGEIGLMQVTRDAAKEWAEANQEKTFVLNDLFRPEINIRAGTWYLGRAIRYWSAKSNPLPYALAEYNAGRSNTLRWAAADKGDAKQFWNDITYPTTRRYIHDILIYYRGYR
ncbi:MAG: lytic transglycosylase domain-containing protein [Verrucomicrobia bacterium]|nr:lytic transglycosylase domain-containing protein [Verrucomicrobiota bacterium]MBU4292046.1 lytic transglycosylase domain-containing protein [Verrucomicrobiota bacterium]MBU4427934.1 lytic transglycosylase domain-containing protein [Verrucomicrobiota bacterium]MCG2678880.1 lytic transglycosylase domain-containing protein [Kiritimatiellia bacterium]